MSTEDPVPVGQAEEWLGLRERRKSTVPPHPTTSPPPCPKESSQAYSDPRLTRPAPNFSRPPKHLLPPLGSQFPPVPKGRVSVQLPCGSVCPLRREGRREGRKEGGKALTCPRRRPRSRRCGRAPPLPWQRTTVCKSLPPARPPIGRSGCQLPPRKPRPRPAGR